MCISNISLDCHPYENHYFLPISVTGQQVSYGMKRMPGRFQFIGSNEEACDADSVWTVLCENLSEEEILSPEERRGCQLTSQIQYFPLMKFRCLGIKVLSTLGPQQRTFFCW